MKRILRYKHQCVPLLRNEKREMGMRGFFLILISVLNFSSIAKDATLMPIELGGIVNGVHIVETPENVYRFTGCDIFTFFARVDFLSGNFTSRCESFTVEDNNQTTSGFESRSNGFTSQSLVGASVFNFIECHAIRMSLQITNGDATFFCFVEG